MYNKDMNLQFRRDESFGDFLQVLREDKETNGEAILEEDKLDKIETPQNMKTKEEPEVDPVDLGLEDHDKDDFNKAGAKVKPDSDVNKDLAIVEVPEDKKQKINSSKNESTDPLWLCGNCDKTFRNNVEECTFCFSNIVERISPATWEKHYNSVDEASESVDECGDSDMADEIISVYQKHRSKGRSREEAVQAAVKSTGGDMAAPAVRNLLMQKGIKEFAVQEDDKYNPENNLKSELTEMFYTKGFALVSEQRAASGVHLEYKRGDELVRVVTFTGE